MSGPPHAKRVALVVNALAGEELQAGRSDCSRVFQVLVDPSLGSCDPGAASPLHNCPSRLAFEQKLLEVLEDWRPADQLILYYSGHGEEHHGHYQLVFGDGKTKRYPFGSLLAELGSHGVSRAILILDACHSGAVLKKGEKNATAGPQPPKEGLPKGIAVIASCRAWEKSNENSSQTQSVFTEIFLDALSSGLGDTATPDGKISVGDLVSFVNRQLKENPNFAAYNQTSVYDIAGAECKIWISLNKSRPPRKPAPDGQEEGQYVDHWTTLTEFDVSVMQSFREQMKEENKRELPETLSGSEFLTALGVRNREGFLSRAGVLLFTRSPHLTLPSAITQCVLYRGSTRADARKPLKLAGPLHEQIAQAYRFVLENIDRQEAPADGTDTAIAHYRYPVVCLRELIANALVHRSYEDFKRNTHVRVFQNRIEIASPGQWCQPAKLVEPTIALSRLEGQSVKRNFRLVHIVTAVKQVEGEGSGIPTALADCKKCNAPEPVVSAEDECVVVTIYPRGNWEKLVSGLTAQMRQARQRVRPTIFLSYARNDQRWAERLLTMLRPLAQDLNLEVWDDKRIVPGTHWREEIEAALERAQLAVMLVSPDYLASEFITQQELPTLIKQAEQKGLLVTWILLRDCLFRESPIAELQAAHDISRPLARLSPSELDTSLADIAARLVQVTQHGDESLTRSKTGRAREGPLVGPSVSSGALPVSQVEIGASRLTHGAEHLFGREQELAALDQAWNNPSTHILSIVAWGGVGKTSLVVAWLARKAAAGWPSFECVFDWSFYSQGTSEQGAASADTFIASALEFFGDAALARSAASPWDKGARLAQLVSQRRTLLVLDGLEPLQHPPGPLAGKLRDPALAALLRSLARHNSGLCLVTTRERVTDLAPSSATTAPVLELEHLATSAGIEMLQNLGVRGAKAEFESLVTDVAGHPLTLNLLGRYLAKAHGGDIRRRDSVSLEKADAKIPGGHAFKAMAAYEKWLAGGGEDGARQVAILRLLGLFDRVADASCLAALRREPVITGLTEPLVAIGEDDWNLALSSLEGCGLISVQHGQSRTGPPQAEIDSHPLVREYFATELRQSNSEAWRNAHRRLYDYLKASTEEQPNSLQGLQPLFQAIGHACAAGEHQRAYYEVYRPRISQHKRQFILDTLGGVSADLAVISNFFDEPWHKAVSTLDAETRAGVLVRAALVLRLLGRLHEAEQGLQAGMALFVTIKNADRAANAARHLSQLYLLLGSLDQSLQLAHESVTWSQTLGRPAFEQVAALANQGDVLHQLGKLRKAGAMFKEAEALQPKVEPKYPRLSRLQGFRYCDLLLSRGQYKEVLHRAEEMAKWSNNQHFLLGKGTSLLILAQVHISAPAESGIADRVRAKKELEKAAAWFRQAGQVTFLPRGLLTRASLRVLEGDASSARDDLDEAWQIAERGSMRLHMADIHLHRARLFFGEKPYPWTSPQADLAAARQLIESCGYWRRKEELEAAEKAILQ